MGEYQACVSAASCVNQFQTLIAGILSIAAALIGAAALWWTGRAPLREAAAIRDLDDARRLRYAGSVLAQELKSLRRRCRAIEGTVKVYASSNHEVTDRGRSSLMLPTPTLAGDWEFMSRLPVQLLTDLMNLWRHVDEHNDRMKTVGGFADDNWRRFTIERLEGIAKAANALSGQAMLLAQGRPPMPAPPIQLD
jgi:hypothetical protein